MVDGWIAGIRPNQGKSNLPTLKLRRGKPNPTIEIKNGG
jgi:hypothetical protein